MDLGTFSVSLTVSDIDASLAFYRKLGFEVHDGNKAEGWLILQNGAANIGIFQGMFEKNILTFNPTDVRAIQTELDAAGVELVDRADPGTTGPAFVTLTDPDGNSILLDQHDVDHKPDPKL
jgi:catechol 2,3-dioxygenase-like lactoylglutathione lyase family enzyme